MGLGVILAFGDLTRRQLTLTKFNVSACSLCRQPRGKVSATARAKADFPIELKQQSDSRLVGVGRQK